MSPLPEKGGCVRGWVFFLRGGESGGGEGGTLLGEGGIHLSVQREGYGRRLARPDLDPGLGGGFVHDETFVLGSFALAPLGVFFGQLGPASEHPGSNILPDPAGYRLEYPRPFKLQPISRRQKQRRFVLAGGHHERL